MPPTDGVSKAGSTATPAAAPRKAVVAAPLPKAEIRGDRFLPSRPHTPTPIRAAEPEELLEAPKDAPGWLRTVWNMFLGNTENKAFQVKLNLIHYKNIGLTFIGWLQTGPLAPVTTLVEKVGGLVTGTVARFRGLAAADAAEAGLMGKVAGAVSKAASPVGRVLGIAFKWLERTAPIFGALTAVQDVYRAVGFQKDAGSTTGRKALGWATAALSTVGAIASTCAAWSAAGAVLTSWTGIGPAAFGTIAICCFLASMGSNWITSRMTGQVKTSD